MKFYRDEKQIFGCQELVRGREEAAMVIKSGRRDPGHSTVLYLDCRGNKNA